MGKVFNALNRAATTAQPEEAAAGTPQQAIAGEPERFSLQEEQPDSRPELVAATGRWDERLVQATAVTGPVAGASAACAPASSTPSGSRPRSSLVTSASPQEGKSFICANLGISLAQGVDNHCLLVDCDLRRPAQHTLFGPQQPGRSVRLPAAPQDHCRTAPAQRHRQIVAPARRALLHQPGRTAGFQHHGDPGRGTGHPL